MNRYIAGLLLPGLLALWSALSSADVQPTQVVFETPLGNIVVEVHEAKAPKAAAYFLGFVDRGDYAGSTFYRAGSLDSSAAAQLIQGGMFAKAVTSSEPVSVTDLGVPTLAAFETTADSGMRHEYGAISLARDLLGGGDVVPEFAIYLREAPTSDFGGGPDGRGFPIFGKVVEGMEVVKAITHRDLSGTSFVDFLEGQILTEPVVITNVYRK